MKLDNMLEEHGPINPYEHLLLSPQQELPTKTPVILDFYGMNEAEFKQINTHGMENWSMLSTEIHYTHRRLQGTGNLLMMQEPIKALEKWASSPSAPKIKPVELPDTPVIKQYMDQFDKVSIKLHDSTSFQDNRDVSTTYLGKSKIRQTERFEHEFAFKIDVCSHAKGRVIGGNSIDILLDTGASKSYMSKAYYMNNPCLHSLPKFNSHIKHLQVGNGNKVSTLFVIPVLISIEGHRFEIYTLVSEIQDTIDLVLGMKNMHELEGELSTRHSHFIFMNRAVPLFTDEIFTLKPGSVRLVKVIAPFPTDLQGNAIAKIIQGTQVVTLECHLHRNLGLIKMMNSTTKPLSFDKESAIGIIDIRSLGYYRISHSTLQYNLSTQLPEINKMIHKHAKQPRPKQICEADEHANHGRSAESKHDESDPYPWLDRQRSKKKHVR